MVHASLVALGLAVGVIAPPPVPDLTLTDTTSKPRSVRPSEAKPVALLFLAVDCPVSNRYAPELARLAREYTDGASSSTACTATRI
jgi:hypothetical protein